MSLSPIQKRIIGISLCVLALALALCLVHFMLVNRARYHVLLPAHKAIALGVRDKFYCGEFFFHNFGLPAFVFAWLVFVSGVCVLYKKKFFSWKRQVFYSVLVLVYGNLLAAFIAPRYAFPYSGNMGKWAVAQMIHTLGFWFTFFIILFLLPYFFYRLFVARKKLRSRK